MARPHRFLVAALPFAAGLAALPLAAQEPGGGVQLTFGLSQRLESTENLDLALTSAGRTTQATTNLSFQLLTETRNQRLTFDAGAALRAVNGPATDGTQTDLADPYAALAYHRDAANGQFDLKAAVQDSDLEFIRPLDDFIGPDGQIDLPDDLDDLTGTGTRRSHQAEAALRWGDAGPLGFGLSLKHSAVDYIDASSAALIDNQRNTLGATLRFTPDAATELTLGLTQSDFRDDAPGSATRTTLGFDAGIARDLVNGRATARLTLTETEDGTRRAISLGRSFDLPRGALSTGLGFGKSASGQTFLTGDLALRHDLPDGQINAVLKRGFSAGSDDSERLTTALSLDYTKAFSEISSVGLGLSHVISETTASGDTIRNSSISASYRHALTPDWGLNLGYTHRMRKEDGVGTARSGTAFLGLSRDFSIRY